MATAKKTSRSKRQRKAPAVVLPDPNRMTIKVNIEPNDELAPYYANYVEISQSFHEIGLAFVHIPTKLSSARLSSVTEAGLPFEPLVQVAIPPTVLPGLIRALTLQKDVYEAQFGPIATEGTAPKS